MEKNFSSLEDCKVACKMTEGSRTKQWIHFFSKVFGENEKCVFYFYVRAETRYWRDQQTEEAITEGNALEATGHRLKPCGYYGLHRKGPIDLEKYKPDQGTIWSEVAELCPTICDPMDCSPSGSSIQGILQATILEWVAISFSRESYRPRDRTLVSCISGRRFTLWATREAHSAERFPLIHSSFK